MPYQKINWQNGPAGGTPVNKTNLNRMDSQIAENEADIEELKSRPSGASLILTGQRRLTTSEAGKIAGLDVKGKSAQNETNINTSGVSNKNIAANGVDKTTDNQFFSLGDKIRVTPSSIVTLYTDAKPASGNTLKVFMGKWNSQEGWLERIQEGSFRVGEPHNISIPSDTGYIYIFLYADGATISGTYLNVIVTTPTPVNPIPITDADPEVTARTKNMFDPHYGCHTSASGFVTDYAGAIGAGSDLIPCNSGDNYVFTMTAWSGAVIWVGYYNSSKGFINRVAITNGAIITIPSGTSFFFVSIYASNITPESYPQVMLEAGATATAYEPYASNQIDLSAYDLRSAGSIADELIVYPDKTGKIIQRVIERDLASLEWAYNSTSKIFVCAEDLGALAINGVTMACNIYKAVDNVGGVADAYNRGNNTICGFNSYANTRLYIRNDDCKTAEELQATFTDSVFIYALKTPIETDLTAEQVAEILALETYAPETIIETELDLQSVDYLGDVKGYIDSKFEYSYTIRKIGKWADGKDFYQMIINTTTPAAGTGQFAFPYDIRGIKRIDGTVVLANNVTPINHYYSSEYFTATWAQNGTIQMITTAYYANKPCEIIVEFTLDGAAPAAASVMALTDDDTQTTGDEIILPEPETYIDDTVVYGGN